jgi:6-pyruvoyl-tetrahydropterin synthase
VARSKIFVRNATILDCAVLDPLRGPRGRSWYVDVLWRGTLDAQGYVLDFSEAKKGAKAAVDEAFDHKLIVGCGFVREHEAAGRVRVESPFETPSGEKRLFALDTYASALAVLPDAVVSAAVAGNLAPLAAEVARAVAERGPGNVEEVRVTLRPHERERDPTYFSYTHSLRLHSGNCQRFHGHSNVVEVFDDTGRLDTEASLRAAQLLKGRYLVSAACVEGTAEGGTHTRVRYSGSQGEVRVLVPTDSLVILPEESSVENISLYLHSELALPQGWEVHAYEGLAKGAVAPA